MDKTYLGDSVVDTDGYAVILTTENGEGVSNRIVLEPEVYSALKEWVEKDTGDSS